MTIDILFISAINAESERVFSEACRTILWERMQLENENIEKPDCLKNWMRSDFIMDVLVENLEATKLYR
jgi:hypothetical protein